MKEQMCKMASTFKESESHGLTGPGRPLASPALKLDDYFLMTQLSYAF